MAKFRQVYSSFWTDPDMEDISPENKYFFLALLTCPDANAIGIYEVTKRRLSYYTGYDSLTIDSLIKRFVSMGKILYNEENREVCILNWARYNLKRGGKPIMDAVESELKKVKTKEFIRIVEPDIPNENIQLLFNQYGRLDDTPTIRERHVPRGGDNTETDTEKDTDTEKRRDVVISGNSKKTISLKNSKNKKKSSPAPENLNEFDILEQHLSDQPGQAVHWPVIEKVDEYFRRAKIPLDWTSRRSTRSNVESIATIANLIRARYDIPDPPGVADKLIELLDSRSAFYKTKQLTTLANNWETIMNESTPTATPSKTTDKWKY